AARLPAVGGGAGNDRRGDAHATGRREGRPAGGGGGRQGFLAGRGGSRSRARTRRGRTAPAPARAKGVRPPRAPLVDRRRGAALVPPCARARRRVRPAPPSSPCRGACTRRRLAGVTRRRRAGRAARLSLQV